MHVHHISLYRIKTCTYTLHNCAHLPATLFQMCRGLHITTIMQPKQQPTSFSCATSLNGVFGYQSHVHKFVYVHAYIVFDNCSIPYMIL